MRHRYVLLTMFAASIGCSLYACSDDDGNDTTPDAGADVGTDTKPDRVGVDASDSSTEDVVDSGGGGDSGDGGVDASDADANDSGPAAANFTVLRIGGLDGGLLNTYTGAVYLDEYDQAGTLVKTVELPTTPSGSNLAVVQQSYIMQPGVGPADGMLARSADGRLLVLAGYAGTGDAGGPPGYSHASSLNPRVIATVDSTGTVTSTTTHDAYGNSVIAGATTHDGGAFWSAGGIGSPPQANIGYSAAGLDAGYEAGTFVVINTGDISTGRNAIGIFDGQLYVSGGSSVFQVGTGLPTTETDTITPIVTLSGGTAWGFTFVDTDSTPGVDTLYVATSPDGIKKYKYSADAGADAGPWSLVATFSDGLSAGAFGVAASHEGGNTVLFVTTYEGDKVLKYVDDGVDTDPSPTTIVTAATFDPSMGPAGYVYRGVAVSPTP